MDLYTHLRLCSSATGKNINFQTMRTHGIVFGEEKKLSFPSTSCILLVCQKHLIFMFHLQALNGTET